MTNAEIDELVPKVYNARVDADSGDGSAARMVERDGDGGENSAVVLSFTGLNGNKKAASQKSINQ